ncbi:MAG: YibE/F family protein, partial [Candidatus Obscuribacterales bacterium]|nr:YibE/F family protein [Candidatus Obscuribacterales bacterium]
LFFLLQSGFALPVSAQEKNESKRIVVRQMPSAQEQIKEDFVAARVKAVSKAEINEGLLNGTGILSHREVVQVEILEGPFKGKNIEVLNEITDNPSFNISVKPGKEVILSVVTDEKKNNEFNIADYHRAPVLGLLAAAFLCAFIYLGGKSALKSLFGLATAIGLIGFVLLPLSLKGFNPLLSSAFICLLAACATILSIAGFSKKSYAALLGTLGGVLIAGISAQIVIEAAPLTGLSSEEAQILRAAMPGQNPAFFSGLLAASMLIGALGVIMDVGISIASAVFELSQTDKKLSSKELYIKGMNVGRDIMGSMTSTLVLAYAGGALPLLLLMSKMPSLKLLNLDLVASEIAAALTGSLGLVFTIPITALAAAKMMSGDNQKQAINTSKDPFSELDRKKNSPPAESGTRENQDLAASAGENIL